MLTRLTLSLPFLAIAGSLAMAQVATPERVRVSEGVMQGRIVRRVEVTCPGDARVSAKVVLKALISKAGKIENLQAISGHPLLIPRAIEAVKQWTYSPYQLNGEYIEVETMIHVDFACGEKPPVQGVVGDTPGGGFIGTGRSDAPGEAKTATPRRIRVSSGVSQGLLVTKVAPLYPSDARDQNIQGTVLLQATIDREGNVSSLQLISGHPLLAPAAIEAVKQWKYRPYYLSGNPLEVETQIQVNFTLKP